ncbi:MAG TPA: 2Fe-2S iron-sulfur cluster binding domain-containing protein [Candidatus Tenderia electrophaga]|uniref:2Fe-2S iron-sulfur cluster binding domain-containing protein n=1 Tax=Candidatus Tenderia electrophaga TaxID=1748243 RepID=A0A832J5H0_9GAMM|nr:2Fe-2S iron-sulfur cluster binding domain-containing protein [Candidatus Tenderia electrophaga]
MANITYSEQTFDCHNDETVLECLARHGVELPSSCRAGVCQTCMVKAVEGTPPKDAQTGLKPQLQKQGYFLACICKPEQDLSFIDPDDSALPQIAATVVSKTRFNDNIMRLRLKPESDFEFQPGQFLNIHREDGLVRSYSIASLPKQGYLELHVERVKNGKMSNWLHKQVAMGGKLNIDGPHGDCFYIDDNPEQNLLLIGTGTGLAPLWGILHDALSKGHKGEIHLFHGSRSSDKIYLVDELKKLAELHSNFFYTACISGQDNQGYTAGRANEVALREIPKLDGYRVYLCGHPEMVNSTKKKTFLAGASMNDIHADAFTLSNS